MTPGERIELEMEIMLEAEDLLYQYLVAASHGKEENLDDELLDELYELLGELVDL